MVALGRAAAAEHHIRALVESCVARGIVVEDAAEFYERLTGKLAIESLTPTSIVFPAASVLRASTACSPRILSLMIAYRGLVLFAPLLLIIAVAVKLESHGPVLFVQSRIGAAGGRSI